MSPVRVMHTFHMPFGGPGKGAWAIVVAFFLLTTIWATWSDCLGGFISDDTTIQIELRRSRRKGISRDLMTGADIARDAVPATLVPGTPQTEVNRLSKPLTISTEIAPGSDNRNGSETGFSETG